MAGAYKRRQIMLRREDGTPGGFIRIEDTGVKCTATVQASGVADGAKILLFGRTEEGPVPIGTLAKGKAEASMPPDNAEQLVQAAVLHGDKLLLYGGEGVDFAAMRRKATRPAHAPRPTVPVRADREVPADFRAGSGIDQPARAKTDRRADAGATESGPREGWTFTPYELPGAPEQIVGRRMEHGTVKALLHAVAAPYAPEPPPGLTGFVWDAGFWVHVEANEG